MVGHSYNPNTQRKACLCSRPSVSPSETFFKKGERGVAVPQPCLPQQFQPAAPASSLEILQAPPGCTGFSVKSKIWEDQHTLESGGNQLITVTTLGVLLVWGVLGIQLRVSRNAEQINHKAASLAHSNDSELSVPEIYLNLCFARLLRLGANCHVLSGTSSLLRTMGHSDEYIIRLGWASYLHHT